MIELFVIWALRLAWLSRSLFSWPRPNERFMARRYLFRRRKSSSLLSISLLAMAATLAIEAYYFLGPGQKTFAMGMVALLAPLISVTLLLLNALSVFSMVAVVGVVLGVAALTVVMAVTSGFQGEIRNRVIGLNAHVLVLKYGLDFTDYEEVMRKLNTHSETVASSPFVYNEMLLAKEGFRTAGVLVKGIDVARAQKVMNMQRWMLPNPSGKPPNLDELSVEQAPTPSKSAEAPQGPQPPLPNMFIGRELQRKLKVTVGDRVRLISPFQNLGGLDDRPIVPPPSGDADKEGSPPSPTSTDIPPHMQEFRVAGIFAAGFDEYDRRLVLVSMPRAQELVGLGNTVTGIELRVKTVDRARLIGDELVKFLGGPPFRSVDWEELNHNLFTALSLQKAVLTLVLFLIILVAAFNIIASLTMMVVEKTREVAILKAMGMSEASVANVFRVAGMWIGFLGTGLGIGMGLLVCALIARLGYLLDAKVYMIDRLPTQVSAREVILTGAATLFICLLATLYPAVRAARLRPVDGLRDD